MQKKGQSREAEFPDYFEYRKIGTEPEVSWENRKIPGNRKMAKNYLRSDLRCRPRPKNVKKY